MANDGGIRGENPLSINKSKIQKILVISLSNIGDIVMTFPVIDILKQEFPDAELSVVVGPKGEPLFKGNPLFHKVYIFHKRQALRHTIRWVLQLRREHFDLVVDLRNTAIPFLVAAPYKTSPFMTRADHQHMRLQHLNRLHSICFFPEEAHRRYALNILHEDKRHIDAIIKKEIGDEQPFVVVSPGAADETKQWTDEGFASLCDHLMDVCKVKVVFVGDAHDRKIVQGIVKKMSHNAVNLTGQTTLTQLAHLLYRSTLAIVNDSAPMHLASYLDVPVLALFGPTDPQKYGPWSAKSCFIRKEQECPACQNAAGNARHQCMQFIAIKDVLDTFELTPSGVVFK